MNFAQALDAAVPLAAIMVPAFVLGFGAIWLALHNGFGQIRAELADLRKDLQSLSERVARIEGRLHPQGPAGLATPPLPAGE